MVGSSETRRKSPLAYAPSLRWRRDDLQAFCGSDLDAVFQLHCAGRACTVNTTEDLSVCFDAVADYPAIAVRANRGQRVDCAFEAIEGVTLPAHNDFKRLVILVLANFARRHTELLRVRRGWWRCLIALARQITWSPSWNHQFRLQLPRPPASIRSLAAARSLRSKFFWS
jgi:hypothetical protein